MRRRRRVRVQPVAGHDPTVNTHRSILSMGWLIWLFGLNSASGVTYLFGSGLGGILIDRFLSALTLFAIFAWHQQCHVSRCYWPTRRKTAVGELACWRHHPAPKRTAREIREAHHLYLGKHPGRG